MSSVQSDSEFQEWVRQSSEREKETLERAAYPRPDRDLDSLIHEYHLSKKYAAGQSKASRTDKQVKIVQTTISRHTSMVSDWQQLDALLLRQLSVNKVHRGHRLTVTMAAEPFVSDQVLYCLVTDDEGEQLEHLCLYNFTYGFKETEVCEYLDRGTRLVIKEPFLKLAANGSNQFLLRVDSPSDITVLTSESPSSTYEELVEQASKSATSGKLLMALKAYSEALVLKPSDPRVLLGMAQVNLRLKRYSAAYEGAERTVAPKSGHSVYLSDRNREQAWWLMGQAAYAMRRFAAASDAWRRCCEVDVPSKEAQAALKRANERLVEAETGKVDLERLVAEYRRGVLEMDVADFHSPLVQVTELAEDYKGVVATAPIPKGTLLVVSKAAAIVFDKQLDKSNNQRVFNHYKMCFDSDANVANVSKLIQAMQGNPDLASQVYSLYPGPNYSRLSGSQPTTKDNKSSKDKASTVIDVARINFIQKFNSFGACDLHELLVNSNKDSNSGVWIYPAYINHSCAHNCENVFIGDVMFIYAKRDIAKGEEITHRYFNEVFVADRQRITKTDYGFECQCELCERDKADPQAAAREAIAKQNDELVHKGILGHKENQKRLTAGSDFLKEAIRKALGDALRMRAAYREREVADRLALRMVLRPLADLYLYNQSYKQAAHLNEEIYEICKGVDLMDALLAVAYASVAYNCCREYEKARECKRLAAQLLFDGSKAYFEYCFEYVCDQLAANIA